MKKSTDLDLNAIPSRCASILARQNGDGSATVLNIGRDNCVYHLDGFAAAVFMEMNGKSSWEKIQTRLANHDSVPAARFKTDLKAFIRWLRKEQLINEN